MAADVERGLLVLVATPIGNLEDLSPRAVSALAAADVVACEDTRRTGRLLSHAGISAVMVSLHEHNEQARAADLVGRLHAGQTVAVVSDAGTPGISDPGFTLVRAAVEAGIAVTAIPGPAALIHALVISGLPTDRFAFEGFLPRRSGPRRERLQRIATDDRTLVFYVSPHRAADDLAAMAEVLGAERPAALSRELTKLHEEVLRGSLAELARAAAAAPPRGEVTVVVGGAPAADASADGQAWDDASLREAVDRLVTEEGSSRRDAISAVAERTGLPRKRVYAAATS